MRSAWNSEFRGILVRDEDVSVEALRHLDALREFRHAVAEHQRRDVMLHEALEGSPARLPGQSVQIGALNPADELDAAGVEIVVEAGELEGRAVDVRGRHLPGFVIGGQMQRRDVAVVLHDLFQTDTVLAAHMLSLALSSFLFPCCLYITHFPAFWQVFFHAAGR